MKEEKFYLGIDIGGSAIKFGWGNCKHGLLGFERSELQDTTLASLQSNIIQILQFVDNKIGLVNIQTIGMGTPGTIERKSGKIVGVNPNLQQLTDLDPKTLIPEYISQQVLVDNDANLMVLAEAQQLKGCTHIIGITIGSGIGCGFVKDGQIFHGAHGYAMELGHSTVNPEGVRCNCGRLGCLEAYSSINGILNLIRVLSPDTDLKTLQDIVMSAKNNSIVNKCLADSIVYLSGSIANLAIVLDADAIVIGGGAVEVTGYPLTNLFEKILDLLPNILKDNIIVRKANYGNQAGVLGAIILAEKHNSYS